MSMTAFEIFGVLKLNKDSFEAGLDAAESTARGAGSKIGGALKVGAQVGIAALAAGTTAAVGFSKSAVQAGSAFDQAMGAVAATMGKEVDEMGDTVGSTVVNVNGEMKEFEGTLRDFAMFMGQNTVFSATQAAGALNYMALAGYDAQKSMEMLPAVLDMAAAGQMELAKASDMVTDTQMAFGIDTERTKAMVNEFAKAASSGNTSVEQLADAFLRVGALGREVNGGMVTMADGTEVALDGIQQLEVAFTAMANRGIKGAEAGTHMRNMLLKLSSPTDDGAESLKKLGVAVFDADGNMRALSDIFGDMNKNMADIRPVIQGTYNDLASMSKAEFEAAISDGNVALDYFGVELLDSNKKLRDWNDIMKDINATFAENGALTQEQKIGTFADMFNTRDLASAQGLLAAMTEDFGNLAYNVTQADGAASQMSKTKLDNLNGDMTLFKSALETAYITLNDQLSPTLRDFVKLGTQGLQDIVNGFNEGGLEGAMEAFGGFLSDALNTIIDKLPGFITAGGKLIGALGKGLFDNLDQIIDAGIVIIEQLAEGVVAGLPKLVEAFIRIITRLAEALDENLDGILEMGAQLVSGLAKAIVDNLPKLLRVAKSLIHNLVQSLIKNLPEIVKFAVSAINGLASGLRENLPVITQAAVDIIVELLNGLIDNLPMLIEAVVNIIEQLAYGIVDSIPILVNAIPPVILSLVNAIVDNLPMLLDCIVNVIVALADAILDNLDTLIPAAINIIFTLIHGIIMATPDIVEAIINLVVKLAAKIVENLPSILAAGVKIVAELIKGIVGSIGDVLAMGIKLVGSIVSGIGNGLIDLWDAGVNAVKEFGKGIANVISDAVQWGKDLIHNFIKGIGDAAGELWDKVTGIAKGIADRLGFSEPKIGPLSNFHTYAPDMMHLFAQGVEDNANMLYNTIEDAFNFDDAISDANVGLNANISNSGASGGMNNGYSMAQSIIIPVYIGDRQIDEIFIDARKRVNMRSGGLA